MKSKLTILLLTITFTAIGIEYVPTREADISDPALSISKDKDGEWLEITTREWHDVVLTDEGEKSYIYHQGYNYKKQKGFIKTYTTDKKPVNEMYGADTGGMVSKEELMLAFDIFKKHGDIHKILAKETTPIYVFGGFGYADKSPKGACYNGQRCLHVFAHTDTKEMIAHAIIKLNDKTVPYPDYDGLNDKNKKEVKQ